MERNCQKIVTNEIMGTVYTAKLIAVTGSVILDVCENSRELIWYCENISNIESRIDKVCSRIMKEIREMEKWRAFKDGENLYIFFFFSIVIEQLLFYSEFHE